MVRRASAPSEEASTDACVRTHVWALDFVFDACANGQQLKCLAVVDEWTRECLAIDVAGSIRSARVVEVLSKLVSVHGAPRHLRSDNGPEFVATAIIKWAAELVLLIGIPATGKSTFARDQFFGTHVRLNRNMLKTHHRERVLFEACLSTSAALVVDNTNVTRTERLRFIGPARAAGFRVRGFFFESRVRDALVRNEGRGRPVPDVAVLWRSAELELPAIAEGFDELFFVRLSAARGFDVSVWESPA